MFRKKVVAPLFSKSLQGWPKYTNTSSLLGDRLNDLNGTPNRNQQERNQLHAVQNIHKNLSHPCDLALQNDTICVNLLSLVYAEIVFEGNSLLRCVLVLSSQRFLHGVIRGIFQRSWLYPFPGLHKFNSNASEMPLAVDMDLEWHGPMDLGCPINILCCSCSRS